jgi:fructose-1,6-bisphosphatase II
VSSTAPPRPAGLDRNLALELVRATEAAAIAASRHLGRGDKEQVDQAAVDAMRPVLGTISMRGTVVIGEGEKDEAPMLYNGEELGDGTGPEVDFAVDPVDGTTLTAKSLPNALSIVAVAERHTMFDPGPCVYMDKLAVAGDLADIVDFSAPVETNLQRIAAHRGLAVEDLTVCILDRPRHEVDLVKRVRSAGSRIKFLLDGDVAGAIMAAQPEAGVRAQVPGWRLLRPSPPAQRGGTAPRRGCRVRPRQGAHHRGHGPQQQRLRRRDGRHRR